MEKLFNKAREAAAEAAHKQVAKLANEPLGFDCGFAWVIVRPARGPFVNWCKKQIKEKLTAAGDDWHTKRRAEMVWGHVYGHTAYSGGWQFWKPGTEWYMGQSISVYEAACYAFAAVLQEHGIAAHVDSRLD